MSSNLNLGFIYQSESINIMSEHLLKSSFRYKEEDPDYRGEPLQQKYAQGPETQRGCTDVFCLILFFAFLGGLGYIAHLGYSTGNPQYLAYPFDSDGNQCKFSPGLEDYPFIYITTDFSSPSLKYVCVKTCPEIQNATLDCQSQSIKCSDLQVYPSKQLATYCMPKDINFSTVTQAAAALLKIGPLQTYFSDVYVGWELLCWMIPVSFVISLLYSTLIRYFAGCMVWLMLILLLVLLLAIGLVTALLPSVQFLQDIFHYDSLPDTLKDRSFQIACSVITFFLFTVGFLIVCCMKRQIKISIGIIKAAADFVKSCCSAFFIPFYITLFQLLFLAFWVVTILFLFSSNKDKISPIDGTPFAMVQWDSQNQYLIIYYIFGLLWIINFFSGLQAFWVSSTAAIWYFESGQTTGAVCKSFCRFFYHVGSIAFGSLLIAIVTLIRMALEYLNTQLKQKTLGLSQNKAASFILKCTACYIACFERLIRFLTENAYIMIAITGKNFCSSAQQSFYLMLRSSAQFFISHGTTKLFINIGVALIITMCTVIGYIFITSIEPYRSQLQSPVFMTVLFGLIALPVAWAFMEFFQKGANTILMCYCVQLDLSKKHSKCPAHLRNFLDEYVSSSRLSHQ